MMVLSEYIYSDYIPEPDIFYPAILLFVAIPPVAEDHSLSPKVLDRTFIAGTLYEMHGQFLKLLPYCKSLIS